MANVQVETQRQTRLQEGLALTWSPVAGAIRYGFIVGFADMPVPPVDVIMKGATKDFAILGIPAKYTGAVDLGSPVGEERQYGLIAYRGDGSIVPVPSVGFSGARSAPRDREYHALQPPELIRSAPPPPASVPVAAAPGVAAKTETADPWAALGNPTRDDRAATGAPSAAPAREPVAPAAPSADPWEALGPPAREATRPEEPVVVTPATRAADLVVAAPAAPPPAPQPADPWDVLTAPPSEPAPEPTAAPSAPLQPPVVDVAPAPAQPAAAVPAPADPWDVLSGALLEGDAPEEERVAPAQRDNLSSVSPAEVPRQTPAPLAPIFPPPALEPTAASFAPEAPRVAETLAQPAAVEERRAEPAQPRVIEAEPRPISVARTDEGAQASPRQPQPERPLAPPLDLPEQISAPSTAPAEPLAARLETPPLPEPVAVTPAPVAEIETLERVAVAAPPELAASVEPSPAPAQPAGDFAASQPPPASTSPVEAEAVVPAVLSEVVEPELAPTANREAATGSTVVSLVSDLVETGEQLLQAATLPDTPRLRDEPGLRPDAPAATPAMEAVAPVAPRERDDVVSSLPADLSADAAPAQTGAPIAMTPDAGANRDVEPAADVTDAGGPAAGSPSVAIPAAEVVVEAPPAPPVVTALGETAVSGRPDDDARPAESAPEAAMVSSNALEAPAPPAAAPAEEPAPAVAPEETTFAALVEEMYAREYTALPDVAPAASPPAPAPIAATPPTPPPDVAVVPLDPARAAQVAALLDEAELYLLPSWLDYAEAGRLVAEAAGIAPADPRVRELQAQLQAAQGSESSGDSAASDAAVDAFLQGARRALEQQNYWQAVDLYEQALARQADNTEAREGAERARLLARWSAQLSSAGADPERLHAVGDLFAPDAPDLAVKAYTSAFAVRPSVETLQGQLIALARDGQWEKVAETARQGVEALRRDGAIGADLAGDDMALALLDSSDGGTPDGTEGATAITRFVQALVAPEHGEAAY